MNPRLYLVAVLEVMEDILSYFIDIPMLHDLTINDVVTRLFSILLTQKIVQHLIELKKFIWSYLSSLNESLDIFKSIRPSRKVSVPEYETPERGTVDWDVPINSNIHKTESIVSELSSLLGVPMEPDYRPPQEGESNWHIPLNRVIKSVERDLVVLGRQAGVEDVGGYETPAMGETDWHIPLNNNFEKMESDLKMIVNAI